jgi:acetoin utilization protein AcuB
MKIAHKNKIAERELYSGAHKNTAGVLTVGDVMTRNVITLSPHHSFSDSVTLMAKHSFRHFLVVDTYGRLIGVVSDRDILRVLARTTKWNSTSVSQFMSRDVISVKPDTEISAAVGKMLSKRINCLPVVDDANNLCGIITSTDFLKTFRSVQESLETDAKSMR